MKRLQRLVPLLFSLLLLAGCTSLPDTPPVTLPVAPDTSGIPDTPDTPDTSGDTDAAPDGGQDAEGDAAVPDDSPSNGQDSPAEDGLPEEGGYYYDLENVVLYLETYDALPPNFITKAEAKSLGWSGGSVQNYLEGAAIGGDTFGNREGLLPKEQGRRYTECDLNTDGKSSRGAERLVFSNDGLYFHTEDHYESFTQVWVEDGEVVWG